MKIEYITHDGTVGATEEVSDTMSLTELRQHATSMLGAHVAAMIAMPDGPRLVVSGPETDIKQFSDVESTRRFSSAMVAATISAMTVQCDYVPGLDADDVHIATKGHICGRDMGKPARQIQKRNDPCCCGSGRKAKRCCVYFPQQ